MVPRSSGAVFCAAAALLLRPDGSEAHSWVACTDYRGDVNYYDETKCMAYPRRWDQRGGALTPTANGYHMGADTGRDHQPSSACDIALTSPFSDAYSTSYPSATYEQGQVYCLAWPQKNHAAATCTNAFIPDTSTLLLVSTVNPTQDPSQAIFNTRNINELAGLATGCEADDEQDGCQLGLKKHVQGQMDCAGFQRAPKFCENTDRAMGTGCFKIPNDMATGHYVFQWYWEFNAGSPYTNCFDAQVVAAGAGSGGGGTTGTPESTGGLTCTNNVEAFDITPDAGTGTGGGDEGGDDEDEDVVVEGDNSFEFTSVPRSLSSATEGTVVTARISYIATSSAPLSFVLDVLEGNDVIGRSIVPLPTATTATSLTVETTLADSLSCGYASVTVRGWVVDTALVGETDLESFEQTRREATVSVAPEGRSGGGGDGPDPGDMFGWGVFLGLWLAAILAVGAYYYQRRYLAAGGVPAAPPVAVPAAAHRKRPRSRKATTWQVVKTEDGEEYYWNTLTNETAWTRPDNL